MLPPPRSGVRPESPATSLPLVAIVTALPEELAPLRKRTEGLHARRIRSARYFLGRLAGRAVVMTATGVGRARAEEGARALLTAFSVGELLGAGLAGGLSPGLKAGDILVGDSLREAGVPVPGPDSAWLERALHLGSNSRRATFVTVDRLLLNPQAKSTLWSTCPPGRPAAADLESASWARVAAERGVPFLIIRSVLDRAEDELPELLAAGETGGGGFSRARLVRHALLHPRRVRGLLALRARARSAAEGLACFLEEVMRGEPGNGSPGGTATP